MPDTAASAVREIMMDIYGYSDQSPNDVVALKVTFLNGVSSTCSDVTLLGKVMAHANWRSIVEKGSVAIMSNVNKHVCEKTESGPDIQVEAIENRSNTADKQRMLGEKECLLKRIAEIDELLNSNQ